eukprot:892026-Pyramimonas_sp.AAC.1
MHLMQLPLSQPVRAPSRTRASAPPSSEAARPWAEALPAVLPRSLASVGHRPAHRLPASARAQTGTLSRGHPRRCQRNVPR